MLSKNPLAVIVMVISFSVSLIITDFTFFTVFLALLCVVNAAKSNSPIVYHLEDEKPYFKPIHFNPSFKENIHFVYLNQKQSSKLAIANYMSKHHHVNAVISKINTITYETIDCKEGAAFAKQMEKNFRSLLFGFADGEP